MNIMRAMNANELIDALGGTAIVAGILGVRKSAVSNWRRFDAIPSRLYLRLAAAGRERGIQVPETAFREVPRAERAVLAEVGLASEAV